MILRSKLLRAALVASAIAVSATAGATTYTVNRTDMWSNAQEPGWGLSINQQADVLFGALFIYDKGGQPAWFTATLKLDSIGPNNVPRYTGVLNQTTGSPLGSPYNPDQLVYRQVGTMTIDFGSDAFGVLTYTIDGLASTKEVTRLTFATNSIEGSYIGSTQDITYDCRNESRNGLVTTDTGPFTITHDDYGIVMQFPTCQVSYGVYTQQGQIGSVDAHYTCPGTAGLIKFSGLMSEQGGIVGTYTGSDASCKFRGNIAGQRVLK